MEKCAVPSLDDKKMKLKYKVEGKFSATFTATTKCKDEPEAHRKVVALGALNLKEGYKKYSNPILYNDDNTIREKLVL